MHDYYTQNTDEIIQEKEQIRHLTKIQKVFVMDHDFFCIGKHTDSEYDQHFSKGLDAYLSGEWVKAHESLKVCEEKQMTHKTNERTWEDGPLLRLLSILTRSNRFCPDDWTPDGSNAWEWDKKPEPPDVDYFGQGDMEESEEEEVA